MKHIYLVRHGQSQSNAGAAAIPNANIALTELGRAQAREVVDWLLEATKGNVASISASRYIRTQQTAEPLMAATGLPVQVLDGLHEFNYLAFEHIDGLSLAARRALADAYWSDAKPHTVDGLGAESFAYFVGRVRSVLERFYSFGDGSHVVYTHGLWLGMLAWQLLGQHTHSQKSMRRFRAFEPAIRAKNCEVYLLTIGQDGVTGFSKVRSRGVCSKGAV